MKYASAYRSPNPDNLGCCDRSRYIVINSVGYYEFDETTGPIERRVGRKDYYLSYNHQGAMNVGTRTEHAVIDAGTIFLFHPHEPQYYGQANSEPIANYWVHFTGYGAAELLLNAHLSDKRIVTIGQDKRISEIFEQLISEVQNKRQSYELLSASLLMHLISLIARKKDSHMVHPSDLPNGSLLDTMKYIHINYSKKVTVQKLAAQANLSVSRYSYVFRQANGLSPKQYLVRFRLAKACELMRYTKLNIRQISALTGFPDQLYFSKLFKKYINITPTEYQAIVEGTQGKNISDRCPTIK